MIKGGGLLLMPWLARVASCGQGPSHTWLLAPPHQPQGKGLTVAPRFSQPLKANAEETRRPQQGMSSQLCRGWPAAGSRTPRGGGDSYMLELGDSPLGACGPWGHVATSADWLSHLWGAVSWHLETLFSIPQCTGQAPLSTVHCLRDQASPQLVSLQAEPVLSAQ